MYIFNAVQGLYLEEIAENIVLLFTHSIGAHPKTPLRLLKKLKSSVL